MIFRNSPSQHYVRRPGATIVYTAIFLVVMFAMAAFAIEVGTMMVARSKMQAVADSAALAAASILSQGETVAVAKAKEYAAYHDFFGDPVALDDADIRFGFWNDATQSFTEGEGGNAVEVTARIDNVSLVFGSIIGTDTFSRKAQAVAVAPARDIVFVVDLSGSMNDDTEPAWATPTINAVFAGTAFDGVADDLMQDLFTDFGYGDYPGELKYIGDSLGVNPDKWAYAEMTKDNGPLASASIPFEYQITPTDTEAERKVKCYSYLIDFEIAQVMPEARPLPDSHENYEYWEAYLDYILIPVYIHSPVPPPDDDDGGDDGDDGGDDGDPSPSPTIGKSNPASMSVFRLAKVRLNPPRPELGPGSPPVDRGWLPPSQDWRRIHSFNNPNFSAFPDADYDTRWALRNKIGYLTYVQFMLDMGREDKPAGTKYTPLSLASSDCPKHLETTDGGDFWFPPRTQPMHSCRRSLISALQIIKQRNAAFSGSANRDRVAIITFDKLSSGTTLLQPLTDDYDAAMQVCTNLQATIDLGVSTTTDIGLGAAHDYIKPEREGGSGRNNSNKVVVLLTDGLPNAFQQSVGEINQYMSDNPNGDFYGGGYYWLDAPLIQTRRMAQEGWQVYPIGIGFGTDYDFMDRVARMGGTAKNGQSPRGSGNPALYEQRLRELFQEIIEDPKVNLAK